MDNRAMAADQDRGPLLLGVSWTLATASFLFVSLRVHGRLRLTRNLWWDDWLMIVTMALTICYTVIWTVYAHIGACRHIYYIQERQIELAFELNYITQLFCVLSIVTGKVSVILLTFRFGPRGKLRRRLLYFSAISMSLLLGVQCILVFAQCDPPRALWMNDTKAKCWPVKVQNVIWMACSAYSALMDLVLPGIAISMIWKLHLPLRKRIDLSLIMSGGVLACICGIIKMTKLPSVASGSDVSWAMTELMIWGTIEINIVIIAACIPTLRPIYLIFFRRPGSEEFTSRKRSYHLHSLGREVPKELNRIDTSQEGIVNDYQNEPTESFAPPKGAIRMTVDVDISYENKKSVDVYNSI